jgi:hypothetical protein
MNEKIIPKNIRELYIQMEAQFESVKLEIKNIRKVTYWVGALTGGIVSTIVTAILIGLYKLLTGG